MSVIQLVKNFINQLIGFFQYYYAAFMRNYYQCKLVGEKRDESIHDAIVVFNRSGKINSTEMPIKDLLSDLTLVANFVPEEALKIGFTALEQFIFEVPENERQLKFNKIKHIMLNSTHDITQHLNFNSLFFENTHYNLNKYHEKIQLHKNKYPCRLVGENTENKTNGTTIIFTVLGKRDGYKKLLSDLISNKDLLNKFHPTEAVKFGFIYMGDTLFEHTNQIKK